ncbi:MAG TPA: cytochrome c [Allosphingosinicella sp.]|nr:cytochrome c [Allosphingosinicella sp.]
MKQFLLLGAALAAVPLAAALAQPPAAPAGLTAEQIVAARQAGYILSGGSFAAMKAAADSGADVRTLAFGARSLARWARTLPSLFPAGTNLPNSHALPTIWSDRAGFEARAAAYATAAQALAQAAQSGDRAAFLTQWAAVRQTCSGCHDTYKGSD